MIKQLKYQLTQPLPGRTSQLKMAHVGRNVEVIVPANARVACVLALLYQKQDEWYMVLIERMSSNPDDRHGGQISFPGGGLEDTDASLEAGALREANEEVGVIQQDIVVLGRLTELYIPVSNFIVHPFVGYLDYEPVFIPQETEVKSIIEVPLNLLQDPATHQTTELKIGPQIKFKDVPYFNVYGHVVWGATAMMLNEFLEVLENSGKHSIDNS